MSATTDVANMALRNVIRSLNQIVTPDEWEIAYHRGQISVIENYMDADVLVVQQAKKAVDELVKRRARRA